MVAVLVVLVAVLAAARTLKSNFNNSFPCLINVDHGALMPHVKTNKNLFPKDAMHRISNYLFQKFLVVAAATAGGFLIFTNICS